MPNPNTVETSFLTEGQLLVAEFQAVMLDELRTEQRRQEMVHAGEELETFLAGFRNEQGELLDARYLTEHDLAMIGLYTMSLVRAEETHHKSPVHNALNAIGNKDEYQERVVTVSALEEGTFPIEVLGRSRNRYDPSEVVKNRLDGVQGKISRWSRYYQPNILELVPVRPKRREKVSRYLVTVVNNEAQPVIAVNFED